MTSTHTDRNILKRIAKKKKAKKEEKCKATVITSFGKNERKRIFYPSLEKKFF